MHKNDAILGNAKIPCQQFVDSHKPDLFLSQSINRRHFCSGPACIYRAGKVGLKSSGNDFRWVWNWSTKEQCYSLPHCAALLVLP